MKLTERLDQDKEKLIRQMKNGNTPEKIQKNLTRELDRLMYEYLEDKDSGADDQARAQVQGLFETAKAATGWIGTPGEPQVWERKIEKSVGKGKTREARPYRIYAVFLAGAGLILMAASYVMPMFQQGMKASAAAILLLLLGAALMLLAGMRLLRPRDSFDSEYKVEIRLDPEEIYSHLRAMVLVMEETLRSASEAGHARKEQHQQDEAEQMDRASVELYAGLLEAACSGDGDYALSEAAKVKYYLHNRGIEALDYSEENKAMFDVIATGPSGTYELGRKSGETETLRPALVSGSRILKKGLAGRHS